MSRGGVAMSTPHPLGPALPGIYQEDDLSRGLTAAFDQVLAPILATIDNLPAYLDPTLTPGDFLDWLGGWVGIVLDETWPVEARRVFVAHAVDLFRKRGTVAGIAEQLALFTAGDVEIVESGGVSWSRTPDSPPPGDPGFTLLVRITAAVGAVDAPRVDALVASGKPAHLSHAVEIVALQD